MKRYEHWPPFGGLNAATASLKPGLDAERGKVKMKGFYIWEFEISKEEDGRKYAGFTVVAEGVNEAWVLAAVRSNSYGVSNTYSIKLIGFRPVDLQGA